MPKASLKTIAQNKKAFHDYFVEESMEAGIELCGTEVKSLRKGQCNLKDAWCSIDHGELVVNGMHISAYEQGNIFNKDPIDVYKRQSKPFSFFSRFLASITYSMRRGPAKSWPNGAEESLQKWDGRFLGKESSLADPTYAGTLYQLINTIVHI